MIAQFSGETREEAIINHFSLELEEEEPFFEYVKSMGYSIDSEDEILESLIVMFRETKTPTE